MTKLTKPVSQMKNVKLYGGEGEIHKIYDREDGGYNYTSHDSLVWFLLYGDCVCVEPGCNL